MTEYRLIMLVGGVLVSLAPLTAIWPVIDVVVTMLLLGTAGVALAGSSSLKQRASCGSAVRCALLISSASTVRRFEHE